MFELKTIAYPLPEDVENAIKSGCFSLAEITMDRYLADKDSPKSLKDRILMEKHNIESIKKAFPYTIEEADSMLSVEYPGKYIKGSLSKNLIDGNIAWVMIDGKMMVESRVLEDAARRIDGIDASPSTIKDLELRDSNVKYMREHGTRRARVKVRCSLKPLTGFGEKARINLPIVKNTPSITDIKFSLASKGFLAVDDENTQMRTARFEKVLQEDDIFFIEYEYTIKAIYREIEETNTQIDTKLFSQYLKEELPHILFTPYLKELEKEITKGISSPSEKARAIYKWITTHVKYSFMRPYKTIKNIPEYAASNLKGDCGVQALLFITLCRISGIPAKWQSGWYTTPEDGSPHDWAEFYLPEYGWCFADCSFGGGAYRQGKLDRWKYYFGSSDIFRTPCNDSCCLHLIGKEHYSSDPTDNQVGEIEIPSRSLDKDEFIWKGEVLSFEFLGEDE